MTQNLHANAAAPIVIISSPTAAFIKRPARQKSPAIYHWFDGPYDSTRGETSLWIAVITQAVMDALNRSRNPENIYHKQAAIQWLTDNNKDFVTVCVLAGLDPGYVRRKAKRALVAPQAWRASPGKGKRYIERRAYRQRLKAARSPKPDAAGDDKVIVGPWG